MMVIIIMNFWFLAHVFQLSAVIIAFDGQNILSLSTDSFCYLVFFFIDLFDRIFQVHCIHFLVQAFSSFFFKYPFVFFLQEHLSLDLGPTCLAKMILPRFLVTSAKTSFSQQGNNHGFLGLEHRHAFSVGQLLHSLHHTAYRMAFSSTSCLDSNVCIPLNSFIETSFPV